MMRFTALCRVRKDMVDMLLSRGRLIDIQMLNFFGQRVEKELAATTSAGTAPAAAPSEATASSPLSGEAAVLAAAQAERRQVYDAFNAQWRRVRTQAMQAGPLSWLGDVHGTSEWSTSHLAHRSVKATWGPAGAGAHGGTSQPLQLILAGRTTAAGGGLTAGALPDTVQVVVRLPKTPTPATSETSSAAPKFVAVRVRLNQGSDKVDAKLVGGLLLLNLKSAVGEVVVDSVKTVGAQGEPLAVVYRDPAQVAARQHVLTAAAYAGLLTKIEEVVSLHVTNVTRYDGYLIRDQAVQMRLAQLACFRYGVESLASYVIGDPDMDGEDRSYIRKKVLLDAFGGAAKKGSTAEAKAGAAPAEPELASGEELTHNYREIIQNERENLYQIPLLESVALNIYAENALMDGIDCAWHILRNYPLTDKVPHQSKPGKVIDYPYLDSILQAPKYSMTSADGSMEMQALEFLAPLLKDSAGRSAAGASDRGTFDSGSAWVRHVQSVVGLTSADKVRLTGPHVNLRVSAAMVEQDVHTLLDFIEKERARTRAAAATAASTKSAASSIDPAVVLCASSYLAEVIANIAVIYRCTAALTLDEEQLGHREWLLTQCFTATSTARRNKYLADVQLTRAAVKAVGDNERYATHPVELMNTTARKKESASEKA